MTLSGVLVLLIALAIGALAATTLVVTVRGGRGPADPPASHPRVDPGGFPVPPAPRGVLPVRTPQPRTGLPAARRDGPELAAGLRLRSASGVPMQR